MEWEGSSSRLVSHEVAGSLTSRCRGACWSVGRWVGGAVTWEFVHYADWSGRAWHAAAVFNDSLFIVGGTPLHNEVRHKHTTITAKAPALPQCVTTSPGLPAWSYGVLVVGV